MKRAQLLVLAIAAVAGGCTSSGNPFGSPFGGQRVASAPVQPAPALAQPTGGRPSVVINAAQARVQDTIIERAQRRGTTIVGANQTGVTLEAPMASSTEIVEQQCGPHRPGRTQRIYLETVADGQRTVVSEDRFIIDGGSSSCQLSLLPGDVDNANRALGELKQQAENRRTTARTDQRPADPTGDVERLDPRRPVVPIR